MKKKLGPLELWQWLALGGGAGLIYYFYRKAHEAKAGGLSEAEEENLLGALSRIGGGGGGVESSANKAVEAAPGPVGTEGAPGPAGPPGETPNIAPLEAQISGLQTQIAQILNKPPTGGYENAPQAPKNPNYARAGWAYNPLAPGPNHAAREYYTVNRGGQIYHVYPYSPDPKHRQGIAVGGKKSVSGPRPKPTPVHHRTSAHRPRPPTRRPRPPARPRPAPRPRPRPKAKPRHTARRK